MIVAYNLKELKESFVKSEVYVLNNKMFVNEPYEIDVPSNLKELSFEIKKELEQLTNIKIKIKDNCILF